MYAICPVAVQCERSGEFLAVKNGQGPGRCFDQMPRGIHSRGDGQGKEFNETQ